MFLAAHLSSPPLIPVAEELLPCLKPASHVQTQSTSKAKLLQGTCFMGGKTKPLSLKGVREFRKAIFPFTPKPRGISKQHQRLLRWEGHPQPKAAKSWEHTGEQPAVR